MVSTAGGSHEKIEVVQPREDEFARIAIERPETRALVLAAYAQCSVDVRAALRSHRFGEPIRRNVGSAERRAASSTS
jgi:hypothetical protein